MMYNSWSWFEVFDSEFLSQTVVETAFSFLSLTTTLYLELGITIISFKSSHSLNTLILEVYIFCVS